MDERLFWADRMAKEIINRKKFSYLDKPAPKLKEFVVKTSASLSGVLHIGRLSDTIRSETVFRALKDAGVKARFIWVAEDMDPMRKVPKGIPANYSEYLGMAVTDIPDPHGCHESYGAHHKDAYIKVLEQFVTSPMEKFSMREEYKKGTFKPHVKKIMEQFEAVVEIQNRYRSTPVPTDWSPWMPICENCGKVITARVKKVEDGKVHYRCEDYKFATTIAKGCGHEGVDDPMKCNGKLVWKSEWGSQWAHWKVVAEGAGREYQVPMSPWWINAEICEKIHGFPAPMPIFYGHVMIDGVKMSASLGNVIYPKDWLDVAGAEMLRLFFNKRLMKVRSFSFKDLPKLYEDYDMHARVFSGKEKMENKKEAAHLKRLFELSHMGDTEPNPVSFDHAVAISQTAKGKEAVKEQLEKTGVKPEKPVLQRVERARIWVERYSQENAIKLLDEPNVSGIGANGKKALKGLAKLLGKEMNEEALHNAIWDLANSSGMKPGDFFRTVYTALLGKPSGPKLAQLVTATGRDKIRKLLEKV
ncbi:MAG: lysine--tRNA ligase [Candidatus Aenigmatarchaeota archaeon]